MKTNIRIIKEKGENYYRIKYKEKDNTTITSRGFSNNKELIRVLKEENLFEEEE